MSKKRLIAIIGSVLVLLGGGVAVRQKTITSQATDAVKTAKALREDFTKTVSSSGKTKAEKSVDLKFQTSGRLTWVGVKEGDRVNAYQAIASMDQREVQMNLTKALRDYSAQRIDFEQAWKNNWGAAAQSHEDVSHAPSNAIMQILEKNQWDLDKAVLDVQLKSLAVEYSTLVTPIAGIVTSIDTPVAGINITPATAVFTVVDPDSMIFEANADETDVGNLSLGQKAQIMLDAYPEATFSGTISYISYSAKLSAGGATVFPVQVSFDKSENIRIGLNGDVTIDSVNLPQVLTIPVEAIREENNGKYVYKKSGKTFRKIQVTTGMQNDTRIVIQSGLTEGDDVVVKGFNVIPKS